MNIPLEPRIPDDRRRREAAEWLVVNEAADERIETSEAEWQSWSADARNRAEYSAMIELRQRMRALPAPSAATDEELLYDSPRSPRAVGSSPTRTTALSTVLARYPVLTRYRGTIAALAAAIAAAAIGIFWLSSYRLAPGPRTQTFQTAVGEHRELRLSEGSLITLEGDSRITTRLGELREVDLLKGGATFNVKKDGNRPFVVHASGGSIVVVGTRFVVHQYSQYSHRVRVWVSDGAVEVVSAGSAQTQPVKLRESRLLVKSGQEATYTATGASTAQLIGLAAFPDRIPGMFMYRARPLAEVVEDLQRYSTKHIRVDPEVAALEFSGSIFQTDVDHWLDRLPDIFPTLTVEHHGDAILILGRFVPALPLPKTALRQPAGK